MDTRLRPKGPAANAACPPAHGRFKSRRHEQAFWSVVTLALVAAVCAVVVPLKVFGSSDAETGTVFARLAWGDGEEQVGLVKATEGLTRGPDALAVAPDGRVAVLDSVNGRLVLLDADGRTCGRVAIDLEQPRFLAVDDEYLYVLDADADKELATYSWSGALVSTGDAPESDEVVTALFATTEGPCVETGHNCSMLRGESAQAGAAGAGARATGSQGWSREIPGRPVGRELAQVVQATFSPNEGLQLQTRSMNRANMQLGEATHTSPSLAAGQGVEHLLSVDGDGQGGLLIGAKLLQPMTRGNITGVLAITRLRTSGQGQPKGQGQANGNPESAQATEDDILLLDECDFAYLGDPYVIAPDGRVFQPVADESGYTILVHTFGEVQP